MKSCVMEKSLLSKLHTLLGLYHDLPIVLVTRALDDIILW